MNPPELYQITNSEKQHYFMQPDKIPGFTMKKEGDHELSQYLEGIPLRFWLNREAADYDLHWHTSAELLFIQENGYTVKAAGVTYQLLPGDILFIPAGTPHELTAPTTGLRFIFLFEMDFLSNYQSHSNLSTLLTRCVHITADSTPRIYPECVRILKEAATHYWSEDPFKDFSIYSSLLSFFAVFGNDRMKSTGSNHSETALRKDLIQRLNAVYRYIDEHIREDITLEMAAAQAHFSIYHFSRIFKECTGQNFTDYLNHVRIKATEPLLMQPETPISWIAHECGFSSLSTFNRTFRKIKGCTPTEYRSRYRVLHLIPTPPDGTH